VERHRRDGANDLGTDVTQDLALDNDGGCGSRGVVLVLLLDDEAIVTIAVIRLTHASINGVSI
jgi:hypothetical protein